MCDDDAAEELHQFLKFNYVGSSAKGFFHYAYGVEILRWNLLVPGAEPDWIVGVREGGNGQLVGFISGVPADISLFGKEVKAAMINFLAVRQEIRGKRLAPTLIAEVTRRINRKGVW